MHQTTHRPHGAELSQKACSVDPKRHYPNAECMQQAMGRSQGGLPRKAQGASTLRLLNPQPRPLAAVVVQSFSCV